VRSFDAHSSSRGGSGGAGAGLSRLSQTAPSTAGHHSSLLAALQDDSDDDDFAGGGGASDWGKDRMDMVVSPSHGAQCAAAAVDATVGFDIPDPVPAPVDPIPFTNDLRVMLANGSNEPVEVGTSGPTRARRETRVTPSPASFALVA
jgi:hypothetical protein